MHFLSYTTNNGAPNGIKDEVDLDNASTWSYANNTITVTYNNKKAALLSSALHLNLDN